MVVLMKRSFHQVACWLEILAEHIAWRTEPVPGMGMSMDWAIEHAGTADNVHSLNRETMCPADCRLRKNSSETFTRPPLRVWASVCSIPLPLVQSWVFRLRSQMYMMSDSQAAQNTRTFRTHIPEAIHIKAHVITHSHELAPEQIRIVPWWPPYIRI